MKLTKYLLITFIISWICWIPLSLNILEYKSILGYTLGFIGALAPSISSILLLKKRNLKSIKNYIISCKKNTILYLLLFSIILILCYVLSSPLNKEISIITYLPLFLYAISFGGGLEELGWRGILQPELEKRMPYPIAATITGIIWSIWHIPLFYINGTGQFNNNFMIFALIGILLSFWLSCIHKKTNSIFYCSIFHGLFNTLTSIFIIDSSLIVIIGYFIMTFISIILFYKKSTYF